MTAKPSKPTLEVRSLYVPEGLAESLRERAWTYTRPEVLLYVVCVGASELVVGVVGEPGNATYEWFAWDCALNRLVETSDVGWGSAAAALREVLNKYDV